MLSAQLVHVVLVMSPDQQPTIWLCQLYNVIP